VAKRPFLSAVADERRAKRDNLFHSNGSDPSPSAVSLRRLSRTPSLRYTVTLHGQSHLLLKVVTAQVAAGSGGSSPTAGGSWSDCEYAARSRANCFQRHRMSFTHRTTSASCRDKCAVLIVRRAAVDVAFRRRSVSIVRAAGSQRTRRCSFTRAPPPRAAVTTAQC
jgi:hypothetical protein